MLKVNKRFFSFIVVWILTLFTIPSFAVCLDGFIVSGGEDHTMILMGDKTIWACGYNNHEQLGGTELWLHHLPPRPF